MVQIITQQGGGGGGGGGGGSYTPGNGIDITNNRISIDTSVVATQTDLANGLETKQDVISDLDTIRSNANAGKNASNTISTYGNIVTHNVNEFATSAQGALADTAVQPGDNVSDLNNDAGFITSADLPDLTPYQLKSNMVTSLNSADNDHYPTAKAVKDAITSAGGGDVSGPSSSTDGHLAVFDGNTGKLIKDGGAIPTPTTVVDNLNSTSTTSALSANQGRVLNNSISTINGKIPSAASTTNQLADKDYVNDGINSVTAYYITKNAAGDQFATRAELVNATTYYSGGEVRVPTRNDYAIVLDDETHNDEVTRYIYNNGWEYQYTINESPLTQAQLDALNSGITSGKVTSYDSVVSTIATYGNIVTHNTSEFATSAQGALADSALQPNDNISELNNDAGYITSAYHDSSKQDVLSAGTGISITSNTISTTNNFGTSSTAAATVQKEVSIPSIKTLNVGQVVHILPSTTSTVASSTLKVNNFDPYPMRYNNAAITTSTDSVVRPANIVTTFIFDGTYRQFMGHGLDSNTTYSNMSASEANTGTATSARTISASVLKGAVKTHSPVQSVNGQTGNVVLSAGDVLVSDQANNILTSGMKIWAGTQANYEALSSYDNNTVYLTIE